MKTVIPMFEVQRRTPEGDFVAVKKTRISAVMKKMVREFYESGMKLEDFQVLITFQEENAR